jgi:hypothetical protein
MGYPVGQMRAFFNALVAAPSLKGIRVLFGSRHMAKKGSPPRIVLLPKQGDFFLPRQRDTNNLAGVTVGGIGSVRDIKRVMVAHLWAKSGEGTDAHFDAIEDLYNRFFQALDYQSIGGPASSSSAVPGLYWEAMDEVWDVDEDSAKDGEEVYVAFQVWIATQPALGGVGLVQSTRLSQLTTTLSSGMGITDSTALVASTAGFPNTGGVLSIDAEQIQYTGIVGNQFIGLARGANGTTPATHLGGATVNVF